MQFVIFKLFGLCALLFLCVAEKDCKDSSTMDGPCSQQQKSKQKVFPIHKQPLEGMMSVVSTTVSSATVQWPALAGGEEYTVYVIESLLADKAADVAAVVRADGISAGTLLSATVKDLKENKTYNVYVRVQRGGEFFALLKGIDIKIGN